jgi:hypothetical protein
MRLINKNSKRGIVNLFADFILSKIDKNENSIIQVSDVGSFYVINGITTSETFLDINLIRDEFTEKFQDILTSLEIKSLNVIDIIKYNQEIGNIEKGWVKVNKHPFIEEPEPLSEISINSEFPYGHSLNCGRLMVYYTHYMFNQVYSTIMTNEVHFFFSKKIDSNEDFKIKMEEYKNDESAFIFVDPPYFDSDNSYYGDYSTKTGNDNVIKDNTGMYSYLAEYIKICKCKIMIVVNNNELMTYIFKNYIKSTYNITYQICSKKTTHLVITNY